MKNDPKDNKTTKNQPDESEIGYKPQQENDSKPSREPATDADPTRTKNQREIQDTDHEHSYATPTDDKGVVSEEAQNSNPGNVNNSDQGANQLN